MVIRLIGQFVHLKQSTNLYPSKIVSSNQFAPHKPHFHDTGLVVNWNSHFVRRDEAKNVPPTNLVGVCGSYLACVGSAGKRLCTGSANIGGQFPEEVDEGEKLVGPIICPGVCRCQASTPPVGTLFPPFKRSLGSYLVGYESYDKEVNCSPCSLGLCKTFSYPPPFGDCVSWAPPPCQSCQYPVLSKEVQRCFFWPWRSEILPGFVSV